MFMGLKPHLLRKKNMGPEGFEPPTFRFLRNLIGKDKLPKSRTLLAKLSLLYQAKLWAHLASRICILFINLVVFLGNLGLVWLFIRKLWRHARHVIAKVKQGKRSKTRNL